MKYRTLLSLLGCTATALAFNASAGFAFSVTSVNVTEGGTLVNLAVTRTAPLTGVGSVVWTTSNGTAVAGTDFGLLNNLAQKTGTLSWTTGTGGVKNISIVTGNIPVINNPAVEPSKSFFVNLSSPVGGEITGAPQAEVTILDTDSTIGFEGGTASVSEGGPNSTITLVRNGNLALAQAVTFKTANGTALAPGDYTAATAGVVTFTAGQSIKTIAIGPTNVAQPYIKVVQDAVIEGPETFKVTLSAPTNGASLGAITESIVTIVSDDNGVAMGAVSRSFKEGDGAQEIVVTRSGTAASAVSVNYTINNGTAVNGTHFNGPTSGTLNWAVEDTDPKVIPVTILDNEGTNATRAFTVTLSGAVGIPIGAPATTTVSITDNDNTVQFTVAAATVVEGTANLSLMVSRTGNTEDAASVNWSTADGTAISGTDFGTLGLAAPYGGTLSWEAGVATAKQVMIPILNDTAAEGAKTFTVALSAPGGSNISLGANDVVAVTLNDNDKGFAFVAPPPVPGIYEVNEGTANITISVQRIGVATAAASATWTTGNGSAIAGQDFGTLNSAVQKTGTLSWAAGDVANKNIVIPIINDTLGGEGDEIFTVTIAPVTAGYVIGGANTVNVTIKDNDIPPQTNAQFSQPKYLVMENGVTATLTVDRVDIGGGCGLATQVNYATVAGTAAATTDYTTKTGTLNWGAGDCSSKDIAITIVNNALAEPPEYFKVNLSLPTPGMGLGMDNSATVLILDDDEVFPAGGALSGSFYTPATDEGFHISNDPGAYEGQLAMKSDQIDDSQTAGFALVGVFSAGNVSFRVKVSTELNFDMLRFFIDDVELASWSGAANTAWQLSPTFPITAGVHHLKWVYEKDGSVSVGSDAVYVDGLVTPAYTPVP